MRIHARTLLEYSTEALWDILTGSFTLVFDDGEVETNANETLYSAYAWDFHKTHPQTPLLIRHHLKGIIEPGKRLGSDTHLILLGNAMWSAYYAYIDSYPEYGTDPEKEYQLRDDLMKRIYELTNIMYNDLTHRCEEYVVSLDITDFIEVINEPSIRAINDRLEELGNPNQKQIEDSQKEITSILMGGKQLKYNRIALASRSKLVSIGQVIQCVSGRGILTDTDSNQFRHSIPRGYVKGLRKLHDSLIESRSASKSLTFSKTPLQQAEYFSRRLQLMSEIVVNLHTGDCGSQDYLHFPVRKTEHHRGNVRQGDLKQLVGKHYLNDQGTLSTVRADSHELVGTTIKMRSVLYCAHPDPYGICSTCFGELSLSVPKGTNIGQVCCTSLASKSSQNVLSLKHLDGSAAVEGIVLEEDQKRILKVAPDDNSYMFADRIQGKKIDLVIFAQDAANLTDVFESKNIDDMLITRVSELSKITLIIHEEGQINYYPVEVLVGRRLASFTTDMLKYIKEKKWSLDKDGSYVFDMSDWNWEQSFLTLPLKHINMSDHSRDIANALESSVDKMHDRDKNISPAKALLELHDLINEKLVVNIAVEEVVMYGIMIVSAENEDYNLPKNGTKAGLGVMKNTMLYRSLAPAMAFENHREVIVNPISFIKTNRPNHPMDAILMPYEVLGDIS